MIGGRDRRVLPASSAARPGRERFRAVFVSFEGAKILLEKENLAWQDTKYQRIMQAMGKRRIKLSDQIRQAVNDSGLSRYGVCKAARIDQGTFSRFMRGKVGLSLPTLDALADVLGLDIVTTGKRPEIPKGRPGRPRKQR